MKNKEPGIAGVLNVIPGLGYIYINKHGAFGWMLILVTMLTIAGMFEPSAIEYVKTPVAPIWEGVDNLSFLLIFATFIFDGYQEAKRHNASIRQKSVKK